MDTTASGERIVAVYADVEKEDSETLRVDRMLVLREDGSPLLLLGPPVRHAINTSDEMQVRYVLALTASKGEMKVLMQIHPDAVFAKNRDEFDDVLQKFGRGLI